MCGKWTAIDIAMHTSAKTFLSQKHCVSLIDRWWCGGSAKSSITLDTDFSWLRLAAQVLCPFLNPDIRAGASAQKDESHQSNLYDALGQYMRVAADERKAVRQLMEDSIDFMAAGALAPVADAAGAAAGVDRRGGLKTVVEMLSAGDTFEVGRKSALASFYAIPAVRFLIRALFHGIVTLFYLLIIFVRFKDQRELDERKGDPNVPWSEKMPLLSDGSWIEVGWIMLEIGIWIDRRHQHFQMDQIIALQRSSGWVVMIQEVASDMAFVVALRCCVWPSPCQCTTPIRTPNATPNATHAQSTPNPRPIHAQ